MDALTNVLETLRMRALIFCRAEVQAPWGVYSARTATGIFHAIVRGRAYLRLDGDEQVRVLECGDVALLPAGDAHHMTDAPDTPAVPIRELMARQGGGSDLLKIPGSGPQTSILCGTFAFEHSPVHPLLAVLPAVVHVRASSGASGEWVASVLRLIAAELGAGRQGSRAVLARLADVLMVHALRVHIESAAKIRGWLGGLGDPQVARAIGLIHQQPAHSWTAAELAARVGMSRSGLFARFSELVGEPPTRYSTRWRMHLAAQVLAREQVSLAEVAERIGYSSEGAFSKAFKRFAGCAPGEYRRRAEGRLAG